MLLKLLHHVIINADVQDTLDSQKESWGNATENWQHFLIDITFFNDLKEYIAYLSPDIESKTDRNTLE